jgi:hypothetical protein
MVDGQSMRGRRWTAGSSTAAFGWAFDSGR